MVFVGEEGAGEGEVGMQGADAVGGFVGWWLEGRGGGKGDLYGRMEPCWLEEGDAVSLIFGL